MPYTPPAPTAVDFDFVGPPYSAPAPTNVIFNFGGGGPTPPGDQLPVQRRLNYQQDLFEEADAVFMRRTIHFIPGRRKLPVLYTVT